MSTYIPKEAVLKIIQVAGANIAALGIGFMYSAKNKISSVGPICEGDIDEVVDIVSLHGHWLGVNETLRQLEKTIRAL